MEEKIFTIPLRKVFRAPRTKRAEKAIRLIREFLQRHMKCENVKLGKSINESVWARGIQKPPRKIRVHAKKEGDIVYAEILGIDIVIPKKKEVEKVEERKAKEKEETEKEEEKPKEEEKEEEKVIEEKEKEIKEVEEEPKKGEVAEKGKVESKEDKAEESK
jgi:large subunit ribosomal protein L31e